MATTTTEEHTMDTTTPICLAKARGAVGDCVREPDFTDLEVCTDCAMILANGELGQGDAMADERHAALIAAEWPEHDLVLSGGEHDEPFFSRSQCDGCGSRLGGDREVAVAFRHDRPILSYDVDTDTFERVSQ